MIIKYINPVLIGKDCYIEEGFKPAMDRFCYYLLSFGLKFYVTSSKRDSLIVPGAIVNPAKMGNHFIGHAVDGNLIEGSKTWTSELMKGELSNDVKSFLSLIRNDKTLRYGGDFANPDEVHYDDGLNIRSPSLWHELNTELNPIK